ncbi:uncharacterized protein LOC123891532 [Trifolium pratense]|uniref:uncharacterized protein LOC123891532 n=1 Tax=Trifolium pratense TaxID=57577 RepID=UPI001E691CF3|nr:uncharacterized protein LOC123891532 [Trifolium pratense]XP_045797371.1 uncharacterized protein LOC123891532 [Trifolium pratense]
MESKNETSSVILKLMGIDKVPSQHHPVRNRPKVLSEDYLQKVASIGLRKKRSSHQRHSFGMRTSEKESNDVSKVVKAINRDKNHNPSKVEGMPQKTNNESQIVVHREAGLYEILRPSKSHLDPKEVTFNSRIVVSKVNRGKEGNGEFKRNIRCKVGFGYSFARKVPTTKPFSDNCGTVTKDDLFQKYWGLSKNASENVTNQNSKNRNINQKASSEKLPSFSSYSDSNDSNDTENCTDLHKLKKRCYRNDLIEKEHTLSQLSSSDIQILQQTCLMNEDVKNDKHEDSSMSNNVARSLDSSINILVSESKIKVVCCYNNNPTMVQSESTVSVIMCGDSDSSSYASKQQETPEIRENSVYSLCTEADTDSLGTFQGAYETSPILVLDSTFDEDISVISECGGADVYDSSEVDDEGLDLNVSSDEDCEQEPVLDFDEKKDIVGFSRTEESRDFSYVVEVLTEAGISNTSLFKDFSTWHSAECPISPSVFETLEKKFGEQQFWKRSERRLLFDRINFGLLDILHPSLFIPLSEKPVSRRMNVEPSQNMIEDELWGLLVSQEKKAGKESVDNMLGGEIRWIELSGDVEDIVREIVKLLIKELVDDMVS